jgi:hypothetical protein
MGLDRKHRQRTQSYIQALEEEVLRLRGVEADTKEEVKKLRDQLESNSPAEQLKITTPELASESPETIMIDWEDFLQTTPEAPCRIKDIQWTSQLPAVNWADAFANASYLDADNSQTVEDAGIDINNTHLSAQTAAKHILKYVIPHIFSRALSHTFGMHLTLHRQT